MKTAEIYKSLFENAAIGVAVASLNREFLNVNPFFCNMFGYSKEELLTKNVADITHPDDQHLVTELNKKVLDSSSKSFILEKRYVRKDQSIFWGRLTINSLKVDGSDVFIAQVQDISAQTELKKLNQNLEDRVAERTKDLYYTNKMLSEKNAELEGIFKAFPDLFFRMEGDGTIYGFEAGNKELLYLDPSAFIGKRMQEILPPEVGQKFSTALDLARDKTQTSTITYSLNLSGETVYFESRIQPFLDGKVLSIVRDITDRIHAETELENSRAKAQFQSRMASLGVMAGGVAHEINNPLSIISGFANKLRIMAEKNELSPTEVTNILEKISRTVDRIANIISGLRRISMDESNHNFSSQNVQMILDETLSLCRERFKIQGIELIVKTPEKELYVDCRPTEISQILLNLLNNAFDAVEESNKKQVTIEVKENTDSMVEFSVADSGPGVSPEIKENIFDPFFTTKEVGKGTGLGLSISRGIIEEHGGYILVDNQEVNRFYFGLKQSNSKSQKS